MHPEKVEKSKIILEEVHTGESEAIGNDNSLKFQFQAVLVDHFETATATSYFITAGVEYANEAYIWVSQAEIMTSLQPHVLTNCD